jgi:flagellar hook-associated protein 1 FlgK
MTFFPQGTFYGLGLMSKSLEAFSYAENITSDDIANVNTPGASQQQVVFSEAPPISGSPTYAAGIQGTSGDGVLVTEVQRIYSESYSDLYRGANASQNYFTTESQALTSLQTTLGDPNSGVATQYAAFQTAVNQLVNSPSTGQTSTVSASVLTAAQNLTTSLNSASSAISQQESQIMQQGTTMVQSVNTILDEMAELNGQIRASTAAGDTANTYSDERDELIDQLSQYLSVQTSVQADGSTLVTVNGQALVNDTVAYLLAAPTIGTASNGAPTFKINFDTNPPASASSASIPLGSGQLAALQDLYNNKLVPYGQQLDQFASGLANASNRITEAGYTPTGQAGTALFEPITATLPISAANIECGISSPSELPTNLASTAAGTLVVPLNSSNNTVDPAQALIGNGSLANAPAAAFAAGSTLTVQVDGTTTTLNYTSAAPTVPPAADTIYADNIDDFVSSFNQQHVGVTASFDTTSQTIVFTRDPSNEDLVLQGKQGTNPETPDFTITDSNAGGPANTSLLGALGAIGINGVAQNSTNAFGAEGEGVANAMVSMFSSNVGIPALQTTSGVGVTATAGVPITVALPTNSLYSTQVQVGQVLTIDAQPGGASPQENVVVTAVSFNNGVESVTFTPAQNHAANFTIASAQTQTLGQFYGGLVTQIGVDGQTASSGQTTQTNLATSINAERQSISGISLDEETQNLIEYQKAYSAAAQTISVLNQNLSTIITSLGVGAAGA